jgi:hypothetical protein
MVNRQKPVTQRRYRADERKRKGAKEVRSITHFRLKIVVEAEKPAERNVLVGQTQAKKGSKKNKTRKVSQEK